MVFCIGVYETRKETMREMRERLVRYSVQTDREFEILWMMEELPEEKADAYAFRMQLAFVSLDSPSGKYVGDRIYRANPDCRICFYRSKRCDLEPVLSARPIGFYLCGEKEDGQEADGGVFGRKLDGLLKEILESGRIFCYETRKTNYLFNTRNILYFQSNLKYVEVHTREPGGCSIFAKLSEIERRLEECGACHNFLRIHKSYLVNLVYVEALDKVNHLILLSGGERLPVSDAQYAGVAKRLAYF